MTARACSNGGVAYRRIAVTARSKAQEQGATPMDGVTARCRGQVAGWQSKGYCDCDVDNDSSGEGGSPEGCSDCSGAGWHSDGYYDVNMWLRWRGCTA